VNNLLDRDGRGYWTKVSQSFHVPTVSFLMELSPSRYSGTITIVMICTKTAFARLI
jgi:hypothetical protein